TPLPQLLLQELSQPSKFSMFPSSHSSDSCTSSSPHQGPKAEQSALQKSYEPLFSPSSQTSPLSMIPLPQRESKGPESVSEPELGSVLELKLVAFESSLELDSVVVVESERGIGW